MFDMPPVEFTKVFLGEELLEEDELCLLNFLNSHRNDITLGYCGNVYQIQYIKTEESNEVHDYLMGIPIADCEKWKVTVTCTDIGTSERAILSARISLYLEEITKMRVANALEKYIIHSYFKKHPEIYYE